MLDFIFPEYGDPTGVSDFFKDHAFSARLEADRHDKQAAEFDRIAETDPNIIGIPTEFANRPRPDIGPPRGFAELSADIGADLGKFLPVFYLTRRLFAGEPQYLTNLWTRGMGALGTAFAITDGTVLGTISNS